MIKDLFTNYFHIPRQQPGWPLLAIAGGLTVILSALYLPAGLIGFSGFIYLHIILHSPRRTLSEAAVRAYNSAHRWTGFVGAS